MSTHTHNPPNDTDTAELIGTTAAARLYGVSNRTIHRAVAAGALTPALTSPGGPAGAFLFTAEALEQWRGIPLDLSSNR